MKIQTRNIKTSIVTAAAALMLASCASAPVTPEGAAAARARLTQLQANEELASRAPIEIGDAELAVAAAERRQRDPVLAEHLVLMADHKVEIASNWAQSRLYEDQREDLNRQAEQARLDSRTREAERARSDADFARRDAERARDDTAEARSQAQAARGDADAALGAADAARSQTERARIDANTARTDAQAARNQTERARTDADVARTDAETARSQTATARSDASAARSAADDAVTQAGIAREEAAAARVDTSIAREQTAAARQEAAELERRLLELNAQSTDRGMVVTLGDVLFETGRSELRGGTTSNLDSLADFLTSYSDRTVLIEGHTDSVGDESTNLSLSQRRADVVRDYLVGRGVGSSRLSADGKGEALPVADNDSTTGRQQNRRVEVIISNIN